MIRNWNETVTEEDVVLHLGDFAFNTGWDKFPRLNGSIRFVRGNHDYENKYHQYLKDYTKIPFSNQMSPYVSMTYHFPNMEKIKILMCHYPLWAADVQDHAARDIKLLMGQQRFTEAYKLYTDCDLFLYGHTHGKPEPSRPNKAVRVCVEDWDYKPVRLDHIVELKGLSGYAAVKG